jgi:hypothetical protein
MSEQQRIGAFGESQSRPVLLRAREVAPINVGERDAYSPGVLGPVPARGVYGVVVPCRLSDRLRGDPPAFAMPDKVLTHLESRDVEIVLVADDESGDVYEFHISQFEGEVPKSDLPASQREERQRSVDLQHHRGRYSDHYQSVIVRTEGQNG